MKSPAMSDKQTQAPEPTEAPKPLAPLIDLRAARCAKWLFGDGEEGWQPRFISAGTTVLGHHNGKDVFLRNVNAPVDEHNEPADKLFTQADFKACLDLLVEEYGIELDPLNPQQCHFSPSEMKFIISDDDMACLRDDGLGLNDSGKLSDPRHAKLNERAPENKPGAVLDAQFKAHMLARQSWVTFNPPIPKMMCDVAFPAEFVGQLFQSLDLKQIKDRDLREQLKTRRALPAADTTVAGDEELFRKLVATRLPLILPGLPMAFAVQRNNDGNIILSAIVANENIDKLEALMSKHQQRPDTNVVSIHQAVPLGKKEIQKA